MTFPRIYKTIAYLESTLDQIEYKQVVLNIKPVQIRTINRMLSFIGPRLKVAQEEFINKFKVKHNYQFHISDIDKKNKTLTILLFMRI